MSGTAASIIHEALQLKASERAAVAEQMLLSLDMPSPEVDAAWAREADTRVEAYDRGEIDSIPVEEVLAKYKSG